eukprot:3669782-Rhodomonas_salina.3
MARRLESWRKANAFAPAASTACSTAIRPRQRIAHRHAPTSAYPMPPSAPSAATGPVSQTAT